MAEVMIFHYRDNDNFLVRLNPNTKLVLLLSYSVTVSAMQPGVVLPLSILPVVVALVIKLPLLSYLKESLFFIIIAVLMGFSRYISFGDWLESLSKSVSFLSTILAAVLLCDTTMPDELSRSLGSALSHVLGRYAYALSSLMEITLSMIPLIIDSATGILEARNARGASFISHPLSSLAELSSSILSDIFWDMNSIVSSVQTRTDEQNVSQNILVITISGKTAGDMAKMYAFDEQQQQYLTELMSDSNDKLWASIIYNVGSNTSGIDIDSLHFENETANDMQKKIVAVVINSEYYGISASSGYCQAWVADVYQAVTGARGHAHCALCAAEQWAVSSDWSKIPVGATVYGYASNPYGHVGIYIGNGQVAHNLSGEIVIQSLDSWVSQFKGFAWGWENG